MIQVMRKEGDKQESQWLCIQCAREIGINPFEGMMKNMNLSEEDLDNMTNELMENFGGMTPFQVSKQLGFGAHVSQHDNFNWWIKPHETAAAIPAFNPCIYGLYRSTVGEDVAKNDFFENLTTYTELDRIAAEEEAARLAEEQRKEAERLAAEEEARRQEEAQRLAAEEEARRQEEARLQAELEAAMAQEAARRRNLTVAISVAAVLVVCTVILILLRKRKKHS